MIQTATRKSPSGPNAILRAEGTTTSSTIVAAGTVSAIVVPVPGFKAGTPIFSGVPPSGSFGASGLVMVGDFDNAVADQIVVFVSNPVAAPSRTVPAGTWLFALFG